MRVKTSITLPVELLERVDRVDSNRSAFLERADQDRRDVAIINRHSRRFNREALETLEYQVCLEAGRTVSSKSNRKPATNRQKQ